MDKKDYRKRFIKLIVALKTKNEDSKFSVELSSFINAIYRKFSKDEMVKAIYNSIHPYLNKNKKEIKISSNLEQNLNLMIKEVNDELYYKRSSQLN